MTHLKNLLYFNCTKYTLVVHVKHTHITIIESQSSRFFDIIHLMILAAILPA